MALPPMENQMRKAILAILVIGAVAALSTSADAQRSRLRQNQGDVSNRDYTYCHTLALRRGINVSRADQWNLENFISACLRGKIR